MVLVLDGHEAEGLQHAVGELTHRAEDFGHAVHGTSLRLEGDFDEVSLAQRLLQAEQASGDGDGLEFSFGAAAVFETNGSENRVSQLDSRSAPRWVRLGEVSHRQVNYRTMASCGIDYRGPLYGFPRRAWHLDGGGHVG